MSDREGLPDQFAEWIDRSLEGTITPEQWQRLDAEIATNDAACDFYVRYLATYVGLVYKEGVSPKPQELIHQEIQDGLDEIVMKKSSVIPPLIFDATLSDEERKRKISDYARQKLEAYLGKNQSVPLAIPQAQWDITAFLVSIQQRIRAMIGIGRRVARVGVYAGIVGLIVLVVGHQIIARQVVAHLTESVDAVWSEPPEHPSLCRGRLTLEQGYAQLKFTTGVRVLAQGPCIIRLDGPKRMYLEAGSVCTRVPPKVSGFTVTTPTSHVEDFGTEFGVLVDKIRDSEIHVFEGIVGVRSTKKRGASFTYLKRGQSALTKITGDLIIGRISNSTSRFVRRMSDIGKDDLSQVALTQEDIQQILDEQLPAAPSPVGWWKLDEASGDIANDSSGQERHGTLEGDPVWRPLGGIMDGALEFDGAEDQVTVKDAGDFGITNAMSVAVWMKVPETGRPFEYAWGYDTYDTPRLMREGTGTVFKFVGGGTPEDGDVPRADLGSAGWHHVVAVADGTNYSIYVDGELKGQRPYLGNIKTYNNWVIGNAYGDDSRRFIGSLDDLRIYNEALTQEDIKLIIGQR